MKPITCFLIALATAVLITLTFAQEKDVRVAFTDVSASAGLGSVKGGRVAWGDFNCDGYADLLIDGSVLLLGSKKGTFTDVTATVGLKPGSRGGLWADCDNDGYPDIFAFRHKEANILYKNVKGEGLKDTTPKAFENCRYRTEGAAWVDIDADSFVDIYIANYEVDDKENIGKGTPDFLFHNENGKDFSDWTQKAGIKPAKDMCGRGVTCGDFDNDGDTDIFVSNYRLNPNLLWVNDGKGNFKDEAAARSVAGKDDKGAFGHTIGSAFGDFDNDGDLDLLCGNLAHPRYLEFSDKTMLLQNSGAPDFKFVNIAEKAGIKFEETHSSVAWADFDNDGFIDFYITSIYEKRKSFLYRNNGDGTFTDVTSQSGTAVDNGWGCAWADYDNDGDMDLAVASRSSGVRLFRNDCPVRNWLEVDLTGTKSNRDAIGVRVKVTYQSGGQEKLQIREVDGGSGTGCQNSRIIHFGFGNYDGKVKLEISWTGKETQVMDAVSLNKRISVRQPSTPQQK